MPPFGRHAQVPRSGDNLGSFAKCDHHGFYVVAKGGSTLPEAIGDGGYCLISPNRPLVTRLRIWPKDHQAKSLHQASDCYGQEELQVAWLAGTGGRGHIIHCLIDHTSG